VHPVATSGMMGVASFHLSRRGRDATEDYIRGRRVLIVLNIDFTCVTVVPVPAMPRGARLDAPGALHHVMVRGIERGLLFRDDQDYAAFVARLAQVVHRTGLAVLAWALLPNHLHLLVRTPSAQRGRQYSPVLPTAMRQLLTGYAGAFNRRHKQVGHLVQNRYRSTLVDEESYLLELVRYIHLNPLRAGVVRSLAALARYPWSGHSALLGHVDRPWQTTAEVLGRFGAARRTAGRHYREFLAGGVAQGRRPEFQGVLALI